MIKFTKTAVILLILTTFLGCSGKRKELSENTVKEFFSAIKSENESKMTDLYPDFPKIGTYYKSDDIIIKETKAIEDKKVVVTVENSFTNGFGKKFNQTITLFLKPFDEKNDVYKIYDSKGLAGFEEKDEYIFAVKIGCIEKSADLTDQEIAKRIEASSTIMVDYALKVMQELKDKITVTSWNWHSGYAGSASGKGIVFNNSDFILPNLKYKITYFDNNENQITTDDGYITYDELEAHSSKTFTFYTSYAGNAKSATISLDFDPEMVLKYVANSEYKGTECSEYQK